MSGFNTLSSIFDDALFNLFGSSFEDFFSIPSNTTYQRKEAFVDGHSTAITEKKGKNGDTIRELFVDGKRVKELPDWAMKALDGKVFRTVWPTLYEPAGCNNKLPETIISGTEIPHVNMIHLDNGNLVLEFALAGVDEDRIEITAEDNYLFVKIEADEDGDPVESEDERKTHAASTYLQRGIKDSSGELYKRILIDPKKYDLNGLSYNYRNGLLEIVVPKTKEPEKNKLVFKKAN